eukprot:TRINITY_DN3063_c0_g1_i1.p1 TRINITY_DN3063_c0_g1~~TRINITY_DN3063_c0_g1_i1.p1  ORF type:complete len:340 (+),score=46.58 TRINITY_DN3063_c0_g1_i1:65-1084(+)
MKKNGNTRNTVNKEQQKTLESIYSHTKYPSPALRKRVSQILNLPSKTIDIWFQNRRSREKKFPEDKLQQELKILEAVLSNGQTEKLTPTVDTLPLDVTLSTSQASCQLPLRQQTSLSSSPLFPPLPSSSQGLVGISVGGLTVPNSEDLCCKGDSDCFCCDDCSCSSSCYCDSCTNCSCSCSTCFGSSSYFPPPENNRSDAESSVASTDVPLEPRGGCCSSKKQVQKPVGEKNTSLPQFLDWDPCGAQPLLPVVNSSQEKVRIVNLLNKEDETDVQSSTSLRSEQTNIPSLNSPVPSCLLSVQQVSLCSQRSSSSFQTLPPLNSPNSSFLRPSTNLLHPM